MTSLRGDGKTVHTSGLVKKETVNHNSMLLKL